MPVQYEVVSVGPTGYTRTVAAADTLADAVELAEARRLAGLREFVGIVHRDVEGWIPEDGQ